MKSTSHKLSAIQGFEAYRSVASSTVRGQRVEGVVDAARAALAALDLRPFGTRSGHRFAAALEAATQQVRSGLPKPARHWGLARKVVNIYLRGALYNHYLRGHYRLDSAEALLEIPLDSITAKHLRQHAGRGRLPRWLGVKHLTPDVSQRYQEHASVLAVENGVERVHLDATLWTNRD